MAFRLPRYSFLHAARDAGEAAVTCSAAVVTGFPKVRLIDGRHGALAKFASGAGVTITVDRGAAGLEAVTRLLIPSGHNLAAATSIAVTSDDNSGFSSPTTLLAAVSVTAGLIDKTLTSSTERYLRVTIAGTGAWELGELWFTRLRTFGDTDNVLDPGWTDRYSPSLARTEFPSGVVSVLELGDPKRVFEFQHRWLTSTDLDIYDELAAAVGYGRDIFWLDPPDDTEAAVAVEFATPPQRQQDHPVPQSETSFTYSVTLTETIS